MGAWLKDPGTKWKWYVRIAGAELYQKEPNGWRVFTPRRGLARRGSLFTRTERMLTSLPNGSRPADVITKSLQANQVKLGSYSTHGTASTTPIIAPTTLREALPTEGNNPYWAVEEIYQHKKYRDNGEDVAQAIRNKTCKAICDGSFKHSHGTAGFCVHGSKPEHQIEGSKRTPGRPEEQSPY